MSEGEKKEVARRDEAGAGLPARNLTTQELEAVIRRAVELQAGSAAVDDGIAQAEVLRIGQELGLDAGAMHRAIAEVRSRTPAETSLVGRGMGPRVIRSSRTMRRPAAATGLLIERYLLEREYMVVQRRFAERTHYVRDPSMAATFGRLARGFTRREQPLDLPEVDVAVAALDDTTCLVELSVDMRVGRNTAVGVGLGAGSTAAAGLATVVWATPVADPFMLLGLPLIGGAWYAARMIFRTVQRSAQEKLESFLDRLEHGELSSR